MDLHSQIHPAHGAETGKVASPPSSPSQLSSDDISNTVIPWEYAQDALLRKSTLLGLASGFFFRVLLVVAFAFFFFPFTNASDRFTIFGSIAHPLLDGEISRFKNSFFFRDVETPAQYGNFIMDVVLPALSDYKSPIGPNLLLGALRLRTQRVLPQSCKLYSSVVSRAIDDRFQVCYGPLTAHFEDAGTEDSLYNREELWQYRSCRELGGRSIKGHLGTYHCGGFYFDVPLWQAYERTTNCTYDPCPSDPALQYTFSNPEYIKTSLSDLHNVHVGPRLSSGTPFIDDVATRMVVAEFAVYNPTLHFFTLAKFLAEAGAGGNWKTSTQFRFVTVWNGRFTGQTGYTIFFFAFLLANVAWFVVQLVRQARRRGLMAAVLRVWTLMDAAIYALLIASCAFRFVVLAQSDAAHIRLANITFQNSYPVKLDELANTQRPALYLNGVATVLLFASLLQYLGVEKRVSRVINGFLHFQNALVGVVLVSLVLLTAFALSGQLLLHGQLWDFRSVDAAFRALFFIQLRQVDLNEVASAPGNRVEKVFFVYASVLLCFYITIGALSGVTQQAFEHTLQTEPSTEPLLWVWRHFRAVVRSPRTWWSGMVAFFCGRGEADRLYDASLTLQFYRKAKYAVVLNVKEKRGHYVTHEDWRLAFVDTLGPVSRTCSYAGDAGISNSSPDTGAASTDAVTTETGRLAPRPIAPGGERQNSGLPFAGGLDTVPSGSDSVHTAATHYAFSSAAQERSVRAHLAWVETTWRDLVFEYLRTQQVSTPARRAKKEVEWMACGVQTVIGEHLDLLAQFPARLASLERQISVLSSDLAPVSFASKFLANSSKADNDDDDEDNNVNHGNSPTADCRDPVTTPASP